LAGGRSGSGSYGSIPALSVPDVGDKRWGSSEQASLVAIGAYPKKSIAETHLFELYGVIL
jgi:hypothetical protein